MHYSIQYLLTTLVIIMLVTYPIVGGVEIQNAQVLLQTLAIITLTTLFASLRSYNFLSRSKWLFIFLLVITPIIYLIPLTTTLWELIPGRDIYIQIAHWIDNDELEHINKTLSVIPYKTEFALFALLPPLAIFLVVVYLPPNSIRTILYVAIAIAAGEAMLAVIQFGKSDDYFYFGIPRLKEDVAHGTYLNPDHFSTLMAIMLPFIVALFTYELRSKKDLNLDNSRTIGLSIIYFLIILLFFIAAFFSGSRAGIPLTFLSGIFAYSMFTRNTQNKTKFIIVGVVGIAFIGILASTDISSVINRFITENPFLDGRWKIFSNTFAGILEFFPFGSGPGTFPDVYRIFQPVDQSGFINHAHNDYLELVFDTGLLGIIIIIAFFVLFIKQWARVKHPKKLKFKYIQAAAGISLIIFLLHSLVEFNMHDSINVLFFSLLAGIFFHQTEYRADKLRKKRTVNRLN